MSARDRLSHFIDTRGRGALVLRDGGNLSEKYAISRMNPNVKGGIAMSLDSYQEEFFRWDSDVRCGDLFRDGLSDETHLVLSVQRIGIDGQHDGYKVSSCRCNDEMVLYEITRSQSIPDGEYGRYAYNMSVRLEDFCHVSHWARGDSLTPIGDLTRGEIFIIFSGRHLQGYVPQTGDRIVLSAGGGNKFQVDAIDDHIFPDSYRALCSPDQRV